MPALFRRLMLALANDAAGSPPQFSLPHSPVAKARVIAPRFGTCVETRLPLPTTGMRVPVISVDMMFVFQSRLIVMSLYGLNSRSPAAGGGLFGGGGSTGGGVVPPPVHEPCEVHGCPEPLGPLWVAGSSPWVHQLAP